MTKCSQLALAILLALVVSSAGAAEKARLATFEKAPGESYFALCLIPDVQASRHAHEVVVLVDTSASQVGTFRDDSLTALASMLGNLDKGDKVSLMALDLQAVPMSEGFVAPTGEAIKTAISKLQARVPLGATDLNAGLRSAMASFAKDSTAAKSVIYIGDGISRANLLIGEDYTNLVKDLAASKVAVSSLAVGREQNVQILAAIANLTGGMVQVDNGAEGVADAAGKVMAKIADGTVIWPKSVVFSAGLTDTLPKVVPPLRLDRDTVVLGKVSAAGTQEITVKADLNGKEIELKWTVRPEASSDDFAFLPKLIDDARADEGLSLPTLGSVGLKEARFITNQSAEELTKLGHAALASGDVPGALSAAQAALARDPNHPGAKALKAAAEKAVSTKRTDGKSAFEEDRTQAPAGVYFVDFEAPEAPAPAESSPLIDEVLAQPERILDTTEKDRKVQEGLIKARVEKELSDARDLMGSDPDGAEQQLKTTGEIVKLSPALSAEVRSQLLSQIGNAIREARRQSGVVKDKIAREREREAQAREQLRVVRDLDLKTQKLKQVMDRFDALMEEGNYQQADELVRPEVEKLAPGSNIAAVVNASGQLQRYDSEVQAIRLMRHRNYVASLHQAEVALIPFPDEPPIVYPSAEKWEEISRSPWRSFRSSAVDIAGKGKSKE